MTTLYQYSHFLAISMGCYDGELSIEELKKHGNNGLGAFNALDGELVMIDNNFYHCSNGRVRAAQDSEQLPWAAVTIFQTENQFSLNQISSLKQLQDALLKELPSQNFPIAFKMKADVENIALGSVPKQKKPYRPISEIIDDSTLIHTGKICAHIVGFYAPGFMYPLKSNGLHLHFVNEKRTIGGHVLDIQFNSAMIDWQPIESIHIILPKSDEYQNLDMAISPTHDLPKFENRLMTTIE